MGTNKSTNTKVIFVHCRSRGDVKRAENESEADFANAPVNWSSRESQRSANGKLPQSASRAFGAWFIINFISLALVVPCPV